jgi:anti-anti-sigma regulatory factor
VVLRDIDGAGEEWSVIDGSGGGAASEPTVTVLDGVRPGARLLRPTGALGETGGRVLQRVAAAVLAGAPPFVVLDLSEVDAVTVDGVAALVHIAETAGEADIGLAVVTGEAPRAAFVEGGVHDLFDLYETVAEALKAM